MSRTAYALSDWQGYLTHNEIDILQEVATNTPPTINHADVTIVNIGAGAGTSTLAFLESRDDLIVFSVDLSTNENELYTNEHIRMNETGHDIDGRVIRIWGDSKVVGKRWPFKVDCVFVDGDHSEAGIRGDIEIWYKNIQIDGYIVFHDYGSPHWPDVARVVNEFYELGIAEYRGKADNVRVFCKIKEFEGWNTKVTNP